MIYFRVSVISLLKNRLQISLEMPPLKQPKDLTFLCYSSFSIYCAKLIKRKVTDDQLDPIRDYITDLPTTILENIGSWIVQSASGLTHCLTSGADHADKDDKVFLSAIKVLIFLSFT